jgi:hypothetical protein
MRAWIASFDSSTFMEWDADYKRLAGRSSGTSPIHGIGSRRFPRPMATR